MASVNTNSNHTAAGIVYQTSGALKEMLQTTLQEAFPGAETRLEISPYSDKVSGFVVWAGFEGQTPIERQEQVWKAIKSHLQPAEQRGVTAVFSLTPEEEKSILEDE